MVQVDLLFPLMVGLLINLSIKIPVKLLQKNPRLIVEFIVGRGCRRYHGHLRCRNVELQTKSHQKSSRVEISILIESSIKR